MRDLRRAAAFAATAMLSACGQKESADGRPMTIEERGRVAFSACAVCHSVKDPSSPGYAPLVGPSLFGVYGAPAGRVEGYDYSAAMQSSTLIWDDATLDAYIAKPQDVVPKTRMSYAGEADADKRTAIIAYLKTLK